MKRSTEINETIKKTEKIKKLTVKIWFHEKTNTTDTPDWSRERTQIININNEKEVINTDPTNIKTLKDNKWYYQKQLYTTKYENFSWNRTFPWKTHPSKIEAMKQKIWTTL